MITKLKLLINKLRYFFELNDYEIINKLRYFLDCDAHHKKSSYFKFNINANLPSKIHKCKPNEEAFQDLYLSGPP